MSETSEVSEGRRQTWSTASYCETVVGQGNTLLVATYLLSHTVLVQASSPLDAQKESAVFAAQNDAQTHLVFAVWRRSFIRSASPLDPRVMYGYEWSGARRVSMRLKCLWRGSLINPCDSSSSLEGERKAAR